MLDEIAAGKKIRDIVALQLGVADDDITPTSNLVDDLGADSLDLVEVVMSVEEEFDVEIPDADAVQLKTVADVVAWLKKASA